MSTHRTLSALLGAFIAGGMTASWMSGAWTVITMPVAAQAGGSRGRRPGTGTNCSSKSIIGQFAFYRAGWSAGDHRVPIGAVGYAYFDGVDAVEIVETSNRDGHWVPEGTAQPSDQTYKYEVFADCSFRTRNAKNNDVTYGVIAGNSQLFLVSAPATGNVVTMVAQRY